MADKHPYTSGTGALIQIVSQLRKSFPAGGVTAETLKKLGLAPNNESYVINILRFISVIDDEGKKTQESSKVFSHHDDGVFQVAFESLVRGAYHDLFDVHGDDAWDLDADALIQYFRSTDDTSSIVGRRQAATFKTLSALSGHSDIPAAKQSNSKKTEGKTAAKKQSKVSDNQPLAQAQQQANPNVVHQSNTAVGLTVRVEVNLPASGDQEIYDRIFKSIRENLINGQ